MAITAGALEDIGVAERSGDVGGGSQDQIVRTAAAAQPKVGVAEDQVVEAVIHAPQGVAKGGADNVRHDDILPLHWPCGPSPRRPGSLPSPRSKKTCERIVHHR